MSAAIDNQKPVQGTMFVDSGMLPNPEFIVMPTDSDVLSVAGFGIDSLLGDVKPLDQDRHLRVGLMIRSTFDSLVSNPRAVLLSGPEDRLWIVDRPPYLGNIATTIGMANKGVEVQERGKRIASGVGAAKGDMRRNFVNLGKDAKRTQLSAGIVSKFVGEGEGCGFGRTDSLHHIASTFTGLENLFVEVARVQNPGIGRNSERDKLSSEVRRHALTMMIRSDEGQADRVRKWCMRLVLNSERKASFWDQQVRIANGISIDKSERFAPINTAGEDRHKGKPGYPAKKRP